MHRLLILAFSALAAGAAVLPEAGAEARDVAARAGSCAWTGYGQTNFRNFYATLSTSDGGCKAMPPDGWRTALFSAKVNSGGYVCLWRYAGCTGAHQVIDMAGYRDMTYLPEFDAWRCGPC